MMPVSVTSEIFTSVFQNINSTECSYYTQFLYVLNINYRYIEFFFYICSIPGDMVGFFILPYNMDVTAVFTNKSKKLKLLFIREKN